MSSSITDLYTNGAFAFPQERASVLCDQENLRLSVWNNHDYLFVQAVLWMISEDILGKAEDNRDIGNYSALLIDVDADGIRTPEVDRKYSLNPWPHLPGLYYQIVLSERSTTGLEDDSKGRGSIRYVETSDGQPVRVDSYLIPLIEISRCLDEEIRLCYWGFSPHPLQTVNSVGYQAKSEVYYPHHVPLSDYHDYRLIPGHEIDPKQIPEDRSEKSTTPQRRKPQIGQIAPNIRAEEWINVDVPINLTALRGQIVLLDFWATWCGPCLAGITHLNQIFEKYHGDEFQLVSLAVETRPFMERFIKKNPIKYPIGTNSLSFDDYGINGIPYAFLIDRTGKIYWHGYPDPPIIDECIFTAIGSAPLPRVKRQH